MARRRYTGHHAVEGAVDVAEGDGHRHNDQQIHRQKQPPHGQPGQLQLEQAGNEIGAAGGGALEKHHAQGAAHDHAAEDAPQNGSMAQKVWIMWRNVDENGGDEQWSKGRTPAGARPAASTPAGTGGMFRMMTTVPMGGPGRMC